MLAILAVSDKRNIATLAGGLLRLGWDVVATEGTHRLLRNEGHDVGRVADLAGVPTLLGGRVKTLTLSVMGGILARDTETDLKEIAEYGIPRVDLVCCNYYILPELVDGMDLTAFRERVDIGGPAMLRGAAKNCEHVIPLSDPDDYEQVLGLLGQEGGAASAVPMSHRLRLAEKAFEISAAYDASVSALFGAQA
ncbi:phosphoribosylaminoimidazolecarboxamide formyltransferase [Streptomyces resistomycificus]|uniref:Phosphoribosylaminoimidazolecarboxamide formyltransferase n=1 Tax=Streptomyces resistomycificus TaxID=67356 RepID=A0A0L8LFN2_9ACTN|nr:phosphoribosylaminoimidazolecarboxamide formyltransferase [Streptomyces resistomycificus]KOG37058.1 phosphoribosylaminoimidazolecarboxamide formyltransferase [Streptomyces resistomycificus]KUN95005.1 phosphoribosylaminoimidazolecarboxamide formyltransferase [Streptomyces resistomycificus]